MDRYHVALSALLALQGISSLVITIELRRRLADLSSNLKEMRALVRVWRDQIGLAGTSKKT